MAHLPFDSRRCLSSRSPIRTTVQTFCFTRVVLLSNAMLTVPTLPVDVSNSTLPVASKSPDRGESGMPFVLLVNAVFLRMCTRPLPSKIRPKMSALPTDVNANTTGRPLESHRALVSNESMFTTVAVLEFGFVMYENVRLTALDATSALAGSSTDCDQSTDGDSRRRQAARGNDSFHLQSFPVAGPRLRTMAEIGPCDRPPPGTA